jgi:hypothetical protein
MRQPISRRTLLRSATAAIALPAFESLGHRRFAAAAASAVAPPKRLVFIAMGWGVTAESWYPAIDDTGPGYKLSEGLAPLARHKADFSILQNLYNRNSMDGHTGTTFWLTGANRLANKGQNFANTISADQVAAAEFGRHTRFTSIQVNGGQNIDGEGHGPGLSLAWDVNGKPLGGFNNPVETFHRLFSSDNLPLEAQQARLAEQRSILDTVRESAGDLRRGLNKADTDKLEEYLSGIRDIETRLSKEEKWLEIPRPAAPLAEPKAAPALEGREEIRLHYELLAAALQTDSTRVASYRLPVGTLLKSLAITVNSHDMSHYHLHQDTSKREASHARDLALGELLAVFVDKLKAAKEADGTSLFDHTTLVFGSNIRTEHSLDNCPTLVAGRGAGIKLGQNLVFPKNTPLCNAWLTILKGSGVKVEKHGDSTGVLEDLVA